MTLRKTGSLTVVEVVVIVLFVFILLVALMNWVNGGGSISFGFNGITETRCIGGYQHTVGEGGQARQVLNENGGGVKC